MDANMVEQAQATEGINEISIGMAGWKFIDSYQVAHAFSLNPKGVDAEERKAGARKIFVIVNFAGMVLSEVISSFVLGTSLTVRLQNRFRNKGEAYIAKLAETTAKQPLVILASDLLAREESTATAAEKVQKALASGALSLDEMRAILAEAEAKAAAVEASE